MDSFNIVELIEQNPVTKLSSHYQTKLLHRIQEIFTNNEQKMFVASFYCFLNYKQTTDFVVDFDDIWKWLGFNQKYNAKVLLEKHFVIDKDYIIIAPDISGAKKRGGHNKETIMLTIRSFKLFCLKIGTSKADEIHEYYIKLEDLFHEVIQEESDELKNEIQNISNDKILLREKTLIDQFPNNTQCVYYGTIDNLSDKNEPLIKFGNSNSLKYRVKQHKHTYQNFCLINAFRVDNKLQIETAIKEHPLFIERLRTITIKNKKYIELIHTNHLPFSELDKIIKNIIRDIEFSPENYLKILEENKRLKKDREDNDSFKQHNELLLLTEENKRLKIDNIKIINKIQRKFFIIKDDNCELTMNHQEQIDNYEKIARKYTFKNNKKKTDSKYVTDDNVFTSFYGSRQEVWDKKAYNTTGGLTRDDLMLNKLGKIVSKRKSVFEFSCKRFELCGVNKKKDNHIKEISQENTS
jgi:hypothetical protein